ncbi:MAG: RNA polymerase sigma-70 factor [Bacteroidales bacterium]|nr:RNA polymerase sigma-70 factor [Bacteroidales bacterium]
MDYHKEKEALLKDSFLDYSPRLINYAVRFVATREVAQDIVQDCFVNLWEKLGALDFINVKSLLFTMVRNACLNYLKHKNVVNHYKFRYQSEIEGQERIYYYDFDYDSDAPLLHEEFEQQIQQVIDTLPPRCRQVFLLSRFEGLKNREIAEKLHISVTAVEKHIRKALTDFSQFFERKYPFGVSILVLSWLLSSYLD